MSDGLPPFAYAGGKTTIASRIVDLLPEHQHYVEPFAGSLAVLLAKPPSPMETVNDIDEHLMTFWRVLRDHPDDLARVCALTPHARAEYQSARDLDVPDDLERARRVWVTLTQSRCGTIRKSGWRYFQDPGARGLTSMPDYLAAYVDRMGAASWRLARVSLECRPALDIIAAYGRYPEVLIYADPPYVVTTRSSGFYRIEMGKVTEHEDLATALNACNASVVLSGYASPLYDDLYKGWHRYEISTYTGQGNQPRESGRRTEVLWCNRQPADHLFTGGDA